MVALTRQKTLGILINAQLDIPFADDLYEGWTKLRALNENALMQSITKRCKNSYKAGHILFYDWSFILIKSFYHFDTAFAIKHILYSRIPHLGIIIREAQNQLKLSHVKGDLGTYGIHPIRFPILGALDNLGELNIIPLLLSSIADDHHKFLQQFFCNAFIKFASEEHLRSI